MILDIVLLCFLIVAALQDYDKAKISNAYIIVMMAVGFGIRIYNRDHFISVLLAMLGTFMVFFALYCMRAIGAGDVKLVMASAVFLDRDVWIVTGIALLLGAVWGFFKLIKSRVLVSRIMAGVHYFLQFLDNGTVSSYSYGIRSGQEITIPFAICFCVGYAAIYMYRLVVRAGVAG